MSEHSQRISLCKAILWEEAKGKLRAIAAAEGQQIDGRPNDKGLYRYQEIEEEVNNFIKNFEDEGLHE